MATGSDIVQPTDAVAAAPADAHAINSAGAAMSSPDSQAAFNAMKPAANPFAGLPDFTITADTNPYTALTADQNRSVLNAAMDADRDNNLPAERTALHLPANATEHQIAQATEKVVDALDYPDGKSPHSATVDDGTEKLPPVMADLVTTDPKQAATAASNYFNAVFKDASPLALKEASQQFHNAHGNFNDEATALGVITPISPQTMKALAAIVDQKSH